ncbi:RICIN domain-containing protein [Aquimarina pacifica]|uniref:RICIN domain-containing protein n=1 Tax=Aquimarina pacifica TaxID=1296415 RepID=UPI00046EBE64|nr:RICIN domain-containing protein [Aquimarina pacifica]
MNTFKFKLPYWGNRVVRPLFSTLIFILISLLTTNCSDEQFSEDELGESNEVITSKVTPTAGNTYFIKSVMSGKYLDVAAFSHQNGGNIHQWTYTGAINQQWQLISLGNDIYRLKSVESGKSLDVEGKSTSNGGNIQQWAYAGGDNQEWTLTNVGNDEYIIRSVRSSKVIDVEAFSMVNGGNIHQWDYKGTDNQKWVFTQVGDDPEPPTGGNPSSVLSHLNEFKITFPLDEDGQDSTNDSTSGSDCDDRNNDAYEMRSITGSIPSPYSDYFFVSGDEVVFKAHCGGATTEGSFYPRSELRQTPGGGDNYWSMEDRQYLDVRVRATSLPDIKREVSMVQIHGPDDEPLRVEYREGSQGLHVVQNEDNTAEYVLDYSLGQQLRVTVTVDNGDITCVIRNEDTGDSWEDTWESEDSTGYFKVGCYTQSTMFLDDCKGDEFDDDESPGAYGEVRVKDLTLEVNY